MSNEVLNGKQPEYVHNKHTNYENTVLQEHANIVSGLRDTSAVDTYIEIQARLFVGICMKEKTDDFINARKKKYYQEELVINEDYDRLTQERIAAVRSWTRIVNDAFAAFINRYKVDGSKSGIAVIDTEIPGGTIIEVEDPVTDYADEAEP
jgi:hypothetical protein